MKTISKIPYLPGWLTAVGFGLLALVPTYAYVRLIPLVIGALVASYCAIACLGRTRPGMARVLRAVLSTVVILGSSIVILTGGAILAAGCRAPEPGQAYIVVLGAQVRDSGPSRTLQERIDAAYDYLIENPDTIAIVSGGKGDDEPISEAQCMFDGLKAKGISDDRVWMEDRATSTWENLKFSLDIIEEKTGTRPDRIGVVSSEFHLFRTSRQVYDRGLQVDAIPAKTTDPVRWLHYFIREIAGVWHYLILGGSYS